MEKTNEAGLTCPVCCAVARPQVVHAPHLTVARSNLDRADVLARCECGWLFTPRSIIDDAVAHLVRSIVPHARLGQVVDLKAPRRVEMFSSEQAKASSCVLAARQVLLSFARLHDADAAAALAGITESEPSHSDFELEARKVRCFRESLREWWSLANGRGLEP